MYSPCCWSCQVNHPRARGDFRLDIVLHEGLAAQRRIAGRDGEVCQKPRPTEASWIGRR